MSSHSSDSSDQGKKPDSSDNKSKKKDFGSDTFKCPRCSKVFIKRFGVAVKECSHRFCRQCLIDHCKYSAEKYGSVRCPYTTCTSAFSDEEIRNLFGKSYYEFTSKLKADPRKKQINDSDASFRGRSFRDNSFERPRTTHRSDRSERFFDCVKCDKRTLGNEGYEAEKCLHKCCKKCFVSHCMYSATKYLDVRCPKPSCKTIFSDGELKNHLGLNYGDYAFEILQRTRHSTSEQKKGSQQSKMPTSEAAVDVPSSNNREQKDFIHHRPDDRENSVNCTKCKKSTTKSDALTVERCSHSFCVKCFSIHCLSGLTRAIEAKCPGPFCSNQINEIEMKKLLGESCDDNDFEEIKKLRDAQECNEAGAVGYSEMEKPQGTIFTMPVSKPSPRKEHHHATKKCSRLNSTMHPSGLDNNTIQLLIEQYLQEMKLSNQSNVTRREDDEEGEADGECNCHTCKGGGENIFP